MSGCGAVQTAEDIHHCAFARPAGTHYRPERAFGDGKTYSVKGSDLLRTHFVYLIQIVESNYTHKLVTRCHFEHSEKSFRCLTFVRHDKLLLLSLVTGHWSLVAGCRRWNAAARRTAV